MSTEAFLRDLGLDRDTALSLTPEDLAQPLLRWMIKTQPTDFIPSNIANAIGTAVDRELARAFMEAFAWLMSDGFFAIAPGYMGGAPYFVTRRGRALAQGGDAIRVERAAALVKANLHPSIVDRVWSSFVRGEFDIAVFQAFREVEISVRRAGGFTDEEVGVPLVRLAFDSESGPLTDMRRELGERKAMGHLFAGAMGTFKNATSHRHMGITDAVEAAEMVMFASHLLRIVDSHAEAVAARTSGSPERPTN